MSKLNRLDPIPLYSEPVNPADPNSAWTFRYLDDEAMSSGETSSSSPPKRKKKAKKSKRKWGGY